MSISLTKAIKSPFTDNKSKKKLGIALLLFAPAILAEILLPPKSTAIDFFNMLALFFLYGYSWNVTNNEINDNSPLLPEWDFVKISGISVKVILINICLTLIFIIPFFILFFVASSVESLKVLFTILGIAAAIVFYTFIVPIAMTLFAKDFEPLEVFNFDKIITFFKAGWSVYLKTAFYIFAISFIIAIPFGILAGIFSNLVLKGSGSIFTSFASIVATIASMDLYGQAYKTVNSSLDTVIQH